MRGLRQRWKDWNARIEREDLALAENELRRDMLIQLPKLVHDGSWDYMKYRQWCAGYGEKRTHLIMEYLGVEKPLKGISK